jgi:PAS domain S-box-containing protein
MTGRRRTPGGEPDEGGVAGESEGAVEDGRALADGGQLLDHQFETVVDQIGEPVFLKDREGRYVYVNGVAAELFEASKEALVGKSDADLFDADEAAAIRADDETVIESGESITVERSHTYRERGRVWRTTKHPYRPDGDVEGVVGVSRDVTERVCAERERARNERALRDLQRLASDRERGFEAKLDRALSVGRERLDLPVAFLTRIEDDTQTVVAAAGDHDGIQPGATAPLSETYCRRTLDADGALAVEHAGAEGWDDDPAYERFGLECYFGGTVHVGGERYGTLCFADTDSRERSFSDVEATFIELLVEWVSYELDRREREAELERFETIVRAVEDGVYAVDADGRFTYVNPAMADLTGYAPGQLRGEHLSTVKDGDGTNAALAALLSGEASERTVEGSVRRARGRPVPCEDNMTRLDDAEGEVRGVVGVVRDVTEQRAQREMLSELVASSRSFMGARDREAVMWTVARAIENVLGFELNVVRRFDREGERLVPVGTTDAVDERLADPPVFDLNEGGPGTAFVDGEPVEVRDTAALDDEYDREVVRSALHLPMGVHGTISIGAEEVDAFSDVDRQAIQLLATSGAAAANRAKREQEVRAARERADALVDRINGLIEDTVEVLVQAGTREQLERGVVEQVAGTDPYAAAWVAQPDVATDRLEATAWEGDAGLVDAVEGHSLGRDAEDPTARAAREEAIQVINDIGAAPTGSVHAAAAAAGFGSMVAVPLTYTGTSYGVLTVYAREPEAIADRERVVLSALGRAVANAVNAIESGRILTASRVIELEFTVRDADLLFCRLSAGTGADLELSGSVYQSDGTLRTYVTAAGTDGESLLAALEGDDAVNEATVITDRDGEVLVEAVVAESLVETLADHGAVTQAVAAGEGVARYTVELPREAEAREIFELVEDRYAATELVGYHEHERAARTRQEFREAVLERFTERQETAVRTAHIGGFFEWPRDVDGDELAASMDISRPTYHQHLRAAQRKVFEELFEQAGRR